MKNKIFLSLIMFSVLINAEDFPEDIPLDNVEVVEVQDEKSLDSKSLDTKIKEVISLKKEESKQELIKIDLDNLDTANDSVFGSSKNKENNNFESFQEDINVISNPYPKMKLKSYKNVKYFKPYNWFDIIGSDQKAFEKIRLRMKISESEAMKMIGSDANNEAIVLSAIYYDFVKKRPDIAENFYMKFPKMKGRIDPFYNKVLLANYLIRTNRADIVEDIMGKGDCMKASPSKENVCWFYLGAAHYLTTGNNKSYYLKRAKQSIKKAKLLYNKKKRKR